MSVLPERSCLCPLDVSHTHQLLASSQSLCFNSRESATSWISATVPRPFSLSPLSSCPMFNSVPEWNDQITWLKFASGLMVINDGDITNISNIYLKACPTSVQYTFICMRFYLKCKEMLWIPYPVKNTWPSCWCNTEATESKVTCPWSKR